MRVRLHHCTVVLVCMCMRDLARYVWCVLSVHSCVSLEGYALLSRALATTITTS